MDEFEKKLKQSFTKDIKVPNQCRNAIKKALFIKEKSYVKGLMLKKITAIASVGIVLIGSIAFATNYNNIKEHFGFGKRNGNSHREWIHRRTKHGLYAFK